VKGSGRSNVYKNGRSCDCGYGPIERAKERMQQKRVESKECR
jgi:hypothetical protein